MKINRLKKHPNTKLSIFKVFNVKTDQKFDSTFQQDHNDIDLIYLVKT